MGDSLAERVKRSLRKSSVGMLDNLGLKSISLVMSMALYGVVRGAGTVERALEVNLLRRPPSPEVRRVLMTDLPDRVRVVVHGPPALVNAIRAESLGGVEVDVSDGHRPVARIDPGPMQLPAGVTVLSMQPSLLQLSWEDLVEREVPIRVETVGQTAPGTRTSSQLDVSPPNVRIAGPALYVDALSAVRTEAIDIAGLEAGVHTRRVALEPPRTRVQYVGTTSARVGIHVERDLIERRLERLEVTVVGNSRVNLRPSAVTLRIRGLVSVINAVDSALIVPSVDVPIELGEHRESVRLPVRAGHLPEGVELVAIEPPVLIVSPR
ncbi:MAG: CdaR family protein [Deltaproteobacteria bacterium]|nr:CdaR family protein [Deltaproteobacteria bacterium]